MKLSSRKRKILIGFIIILFIFALNLFQKEVKNFFYSISSPIQKTFWRVGDNVSNFFETIAEIKNLKNENEELKLKIQELLAANTSLKEFKKENEILREALEIGLEKDFKLTLAEVISKDISQDFILINKGSEDGISKGLPVITQQKILYGKIGELYSNHSKVILISHKDSSFGAQISDTEIYGVVKGKGSFQLFLDLVPQDKEIKVGNLIVTTSLSGVFPKGILVGEIKKVKKSDIEPFQQAEISPFFDIKEIEALFIILEY